MNLATILVLAAVYAAAVVPMIIRNGQLYRKLRQERRDLFTATGLLWALADRTEPKTLYVPKDKLTPAKGGPAVTLNESDNGWTITAGTHHQEES